MTTPQSDSTAGALSVITKSLDKVEAWVEGQNYKGYEPFDGLSSWFRPLTFGNLMGERLLQQLIRQSPINLRPVMGVAKQDSTKGRGYMAAGYVLRYRTTGRPEYLDKAAACLDWLDKNKAPKFQDHSWSNCFDFSSRGGKYTRHDPIIVWTSLIGHAYLDAFEVTGEKRWLQIADSACRWIVHLPREKTASGDCISYLSFVQSSIHNANMLGASLLARAAKHTGNAEYVNLARSAMLYSCSRQLPDGAWWYAEEPMYHWIDNFHTGYNLDSLKHYLDATGDETWRKNLRDGLQFYKDHFFEKDGCPKYYHNRCYPIDIQCAGQSLETLAVFSEVDPACLDLAVKAALWIIENMQDNDGHFYYRIYPLMKAKTPMLHWGQGTMYKGLAQLAARLQQPSAVPISPLEGPKGE
jgi:rhamnogalacturonyl hydrolase YesR